jgi:type IV pilus assembly protein PilV
MRRKTMMNAQTQKSQSGVMLLEALVAILIFSIGIVAVMGMQAASIAQVTQAKFRTDASYLANQIMGAMWVDLPNVASYATVGYVGRSAWDTVVSKSLPSGVATITVVGNAVAVAPAVPTGAQVTVTITWKLPEESVTHQFVTSTMMIQS